MPHDRVAQGADQGLRNDTVTGAQGGTVVPLERDPLGQEPDEVRETRGDTERCPSSGPVHRHESWPSILFGIDDDRVTGHIADYDPLSPPSGRQSAAVSASEAVAFLGVEERGRGIELQPLNDPGHHDVHRVGVSIEVLQDAREGKGAT